MPIGNITSQIFANIYLNELDWFIKRKIKAKNYFRYADDFIIIHQDEAYLNDILNLIDEFLEKELKLQLHPSKVSIDKFHQGIDFLGYVLRPHHSVLRTNTKRRMFKKLGKKYADFQEGLISEKKLNQSLQSYLGILKHCKGHNIQKQIEKIYTFRRPTESV
ncbi:MAG: RNA-directed DNA polymerase (Reverse transcriptase) [Candidatus Moranbacteria bacterium GW2011_GWE1_36_7]|nr:MAG: RNA-directed DNA polymerase (Reverse transcriptase) [Candidatus Moranbacteria bacterium GW2011_GWD2_36_12]KKQ07057.1 MAG: RNA-directed DNA polymerase (Reverse transcriptase) [Candidatus Moranbacteria bacterium GW2011_GWE2_36_40]KKQ13607.1 MAG: RNA-directed DNA polymerase (Reverse transcriptase) [Candidatus Moranbacteria bacterium GW2011_GWE1_36_7]